MATQLAEIRPAGHVKVTEPMFTPHRIFHHHFRRAAPLSNTTFARGVKPFRSLGIFLVLLGTGVGTASATPVTDRSSHHSSAFATHAQKRFAGTTRHRRRSRKRVTNSRDIVPIIVQPSAAKHLTLLKIGDSLAEELGFGLNDVLGKNQNVTIIQNAVGDTGLARPDYYNWPLHLQQELATYHPRGVIVMLGGDDGQGFSYKGQTVVFGSAIWHTVYSQRVASMMSEATAAGAHMIWVGLPIMRSSYFSLEMAQMNAIYAAQAANYPGVTYVPTWGLFANAAGQYSASLLGSAGQLELMRNPDGIHFSGAGADRLAVTTVHAMNAAWKIHL